MPGISFDRAAEYYDVTRGYAPGSAEGIRDAIVQHTGADRNTRFLELGVGTGRIALPFIRAGYRYTGIDLSRAMMTRLAASAAAGPESIRPGRHLVEGDVSALPFVGGSFDVLIAVHVLHLVSDWQAALREARRVVHPGGMLLLANDDDTSWERQPTRLPPARVRDRWLELRQELGFGQSDGAELFWGRDDRLAGYLRSLDAQTEVVELARFERPPVSAREMLERYRARMYSSDWSTPDTVHAEAVRRLEAWMEAQISDPDRPYVVEGLFTAISAVWPSAPAPRPPRWGRAPV